MQEIEDKLKARTVRTTSRGGRAGVRRRDPPHRPTFAVGAAAAGTGLPRDGFRPAVLAVRASPVAQRLPAADQIRTPRAAAAGTPRRGAQGPGAGHRTAAPPLPQRRSGIAYTVAHRLPRGRDADRPRRHLGRRGSGRAVLCFGAARGPQATCPLKSRFRGRSCALVAVERTEVLLRRSPDRRACAGMGCGVWLSNGPMGGRPGRPPPLTELTLRNKPHLQQHGRRLYCSGAVWLRDLQARTAWSFREDHRPSTTRPSATHALALP
jgi:hypothetical protein